MIAVDRRSAAVAIHACFAVATLLGCSHLLCQSFATSITRPAAPLLADMRSSVLPASSIHQISLSTLFNCSQLQAVGFANKPLWFQASQRHCTSASKLGPVVSCLNIQALRLQHERHACVKLMNGDSLHWTCQTVDCNVSTKIGAGDFLPANE